MNHQVLARKWRPQSFLDLVGQTHVMQALRNALSQQRLHHAYLFTGTRGVGKTTIARIFAKALNCEKGISDNPCRECQNCLDIEQGRFVDLLEIDAASRTKVEDTRDLLDNVQYAPTRGRYKIYLIDEVHMLSNHSFNALLKTLEEPPKHVIFLLATTDPQKLPVTVLSRCLQFHLKNLPIEQIATYLAEVLRTEQISFETQALTEIARAADGSMRDALSLLDQAIASSDYNVNQQAILSMLGIQGKEQLQPLLQSIIQRNIEEALVCAKQLAEIGADFHYFLDMLLEAFHQIAVIQLTNISDAELSTFAKQCNHTETQLFYQSALISKRDLALAPSPQIGFEMALLRMMAFKPTSIATRASSAEPQITTSAKATSSSIAKPTSVATGTAPTNKSISTDAPPWETSLKTSDAPAIKPQETITQSNENSITASDDPWSNAIPQLGLVGFTKALAENLSLISWQDDQVLLSLSEVHAPMLKDRHRQMIAEALSKYSQKNIDVQIQVGNKAAHASPKEQREQITSQKQQAALTRFEQDENLQKTLSVYDGKVLPDTLQIDNG